MQIGRLGTLENLSDIDTGLAKYLRIVAAVAHQPADVHVFAGLIDRWNFVTRWQCGKLVPIAIEEWMRIDDKSASVTFDNIFKGGVELAVATSLPNDRLSSEHTRRDQEFACHLLGDD